LKQTHIRSKIYGVVALVGLVMAMGPVLKWSNMPLTVHLPWQSQAIALPLPGRLFYKYAPMFNVIRVWARFSLVTSFAIGVLASLALASLRRRMRYGQWVSLGLIALVWLESFGQPCSVVPTAVMEREVDRWLAAQSGQFAIMELPLAQRLNGSLMYSRMLHDKQLALGYTAAIPAHFRKAVAPLQGFPNRETVKVLRNWQVRYLLYTTSDPSTFRIRVAPAIAQLKNLVYVTELGGYPGERVYVYAIVP
jgi:hypothetical protein